MPGRTNAGYEAVEQGTRSENMEYQTHRQEEGQQSSHKDTDSSKFRPIYLYYFLFSSSLHTSLSISLSLYIYIAKFLEPIPCKLTGLVINYLQRMSAA